MLGSGSPGVGHERRQQVFWEIKIENGGKEES